MESTRAGANGFARRGDFRLAGLGDVFIGLQGFVVDLVDVKLRRVVWRGKASDTISPNKTNEEREKKLISSLGQMFAGYPPASGPAKPTS